jgi:hypothetical protein
LLRASPGHRCAQGIKTYRLAADSEVSRNKWMAAIQNATAVDMSADDDKRLLTIFQEIDEV